MAVEIDKLGPIEAKAEVEAEGKERAQRVRIGLTGLGVVFLLVLLGAAITNWSTDPPTANQTVANATPAEPNEPLAEIGAAPGESSAANAATDNKQ